MVSVSSRMTGEQEVQARLAGLLDQKPAIEAMAESLKVLQQEASRFPPQPDRMRSGHFNTWVREVGRLPRSAFFKVSGERRVKPSRRGGVQKESEKLLAHWKTADRVVTVSGNKITGRVENPVTYAKWVQGEEQASFHAKTPWKKVTTIYREQYARIRRIFEQAYSRLTSK